MLVKRPCYNRVNPQGAPTELGLCRDKRSYNYIKIECSSQDQSLMTLMKNESSLIQDPATQISENSFMC